jgi:choline dehydrogenase-like flavoprotein
VYDVVVVGAGSAGCALAGRLAPRIAGSVLLIEAGTAVPGAADVASLDATAPGHSRNWAHPAELAPGIPAVVPRGRGVGGSGAINGAVWTYVTPADAAGWDLPGWHYPTLRYWYAIAEREGQYATDGPVPVLVPSGELLHPSAERFLAAAETLGFPAEPDKNAGGPPGAGLVPSNSRDGLRIDAARAYLPRVLTPGAQRLVEHAESPFSTRRVSDLDTASRDVEHAAAHGSWPGAQRIMEPRGPAVRADTTVERVLLEHGRAVGVELAGGERIPAGEVVLCAGAVGTPRILLRSGLGPADALRAAGIDVRLDLPDVGRGWSDHPAVFLPFRTNDPPPHLHAPTSQAALHWDAGADPAGDVEVLLFTRPFFTGGDLHLMCGLQQPDSRGVLDLDHISYGYLRTEHDRRRLRHALRTGADLLRAGLGVRSEPGGDVLGNDRTLDAWIAAHLTTAVHLCGSAALGRVVDPDLRVFGIDGLRVADTSVLPTVPRRGPAATAVAIGEKAAALVAG